MTPEFVKEVIEESGADIKQAVRDQVISSVSSTLKWNIDDHVRGIVQKFLEEEIKPETLKILTKNKGTILKAVENSLDGISDEISGTLTKKAVENLSSSYNTRDLVKAVFGTGI